MTTRLTVGDIENMGELEGLDTCHLKIACALDDLIADWKLMSAEIERLEAHEIKSLKEQHVEYIEAKIYEYEEVINKLEAKVKELEETKSQLSELRNYCTLTFGESHPEIKKCPHELKIEELRALVMIRELKRYDTDS